MMSIVYLLSMGFQRLFFVTQLLTNILLSSEHGVFLMTSNWWSPSIHFKYTEWQSFNISCHSELSSTKLDLQLNLSDHKTETGGWWWRSSVFWLHLRTLWPMGTLGSVTNGTVREFFSNSWHNSQCLDGAGDSTIITKCLVMIFYNTVKREILYAIHK